MDRISKVLIIFMVIVALLLVVLISVSFDANEKVIKIGSIIPLTGPGADAGEQIQLGINQAVNEINTNGGIEGKKIVSIVEDSQTNPSIGVSSFNKLADLDKVNVVVSSISSVSSSIVPLAEQKQVPIISIVATSPGLTDNEWAFRYYSTAETEVPPIIQISDNLEIRRLGVLYLNDDFGNGIFNSLNLKSNADVFGESFLRTSNDYRTEITKLLSKEPDAIVVVGLPPHIINGVKQLKELNYNGVIITPSTSSLPNIRDSLETMEITVFLGSPITYKDDKIPNHYFAAGYDSIYLIKNSVENEGPSRKEIKNGLSKIETFEGLFGRVNNNNREFNFDLIPAKVENGELVFL